MYQINLRFKNKDEYLAYLCSLKEQGICLQDQNGDINPIICDFDFILADETGKEYIHTRKLP